MKRIARTLEASLATHSASANQDMLDERQAGIAQLGTAERLIVQQLDAFAGKYPKAATTTLKGLARAVGGVSYIGNGAFSSVYRRGNEVLKINRQSAVWEESVRQYFVTDHDARYQSLRGYMAGMIADQTLCIDQHPLGDYRVVMARQPFAQGQGLDLFATNTLDLNYDDIVAYCERQPAAAGQLGDLVLATFESHYDTNMVPDINGIDNFRLVGPTEHLQLVDTEPISHDEHAGVHDLILRQADVLAAFLDAA